ncbi:MULTISPECIES: SlyX family protein [unclassified Zymobacter]|uniref:SlyX family protein n=1 Tax=unclassified Zymobacter TaxID=3048685 RepID=UPI0039C0E9FB
MAQDALPASFLEQIEALETRLAFQEDWLESLDRTVIEQGRQIERLERMNALLQQRLREQGETQNRFSPMPSLEDERPPHY